MPEANENQSQQALPDAEFDEAALHAEMDAQTSSGEADGEAKAAIATEREASRKGWVPKDQFKGHPKDWIDAATFIDRGNNIASNLQRKVAALESKIAAQDALGAQFKEFHEKAIKAKDAEVAQAIADMRKQHKEAIRDGDDDAAIALEDRIEVLRDEQKAAKAEAEKPVEQKMAPEMEEWIADGNDWFATDTKMQAYAVTLGQELMSNGEKARGREFLDKVTEMMRETFPGKFGNPRRNAPGSAESSSRSTSNAGTPGRTARDLPAADRQQMNEFIKAGWITQDQFLADYRW